MQKTYKYSSEVNKVPETPDCDVYVEDNPLSTEELINSLSKVVMHQDEFRREWGFNWRVYVLLLKIVSNWVIKQQPSTVAGLVKEERSQLTITTHHLKRMQQRGLLTVQRRTQGNKLGYYWFPTEIALSLFSIKEVA